MEEQNRIERIRHMEKILDTLSAAQAALREVLRQFPGHCEEWEGAIDAEIEESGSC